MSCEVRGRVAGRTSAREHAANATSTPPNDLIMLNQAARRAERFDPRGRTGSDRANHRRRARDNRSLQLFRCHRIGSSTASFSIVSEQGSVYRVQMSFKSISSAEPAQLSARVFYILAAAKCRASSRPQKVVLLSGRSAGPPVAEQA